jgi:hypothetical protein
MLCHALCGKTTRLQSVPAGKIRAQKLPAFARKPRLFRNLNCMNVDPLENEAPASSETVVTAVAAQPAPAPVPSQPVFDPRRRIRELMSIPERDRTDAEWDELNELEIQTAPGNRASGQPAYGYSGKPGVSGGGGGGMSKNRFKAKPRKPGGHNPGNPGNPGGNRPNQPRPNKPPRPA